MKKSQVGRGFLAVLAAGGVGLAALVSAAPAGAVADAPDPNCAPATIVGTNGNDVLRHTAE
jgi:hypothetical protein